MSVDLAEALRGMGIRDERVLSAFAEVPRAAFVPERLRDEADADRPLPIGLGQTISQPFVVAHMTELLRLAGNERILEVGTGSGYQTAILARLAEEVFSVEILAALGERAREVLLERLAIANVRLRVGDGAFGWPEQAPFDRILVTAAATEVPPALVAQLARGGRLVLPVGREADAQVIRIVDRDVEGRVHEADGLPVRFVPLTHARPDPLPG